MQRLALITGILLSLTTTLKGAPVEINAPDGFVLKGDYLVGAPGQGGVLLLHQCNLDRRMYDPITAILQKDGIHTLAVDFRLYGESQSDEYSIRNYDGLSRREALPLRRKVMDEKWDGDVLAAYDYLRARVGEGRPIGVIGASCGGFQAVQVASERPVATLALFSFGVTEEMAATYGALPATPTLFISAEPEASFAQRLFDMETHPGNRFIQYKGKGHGEPLMNRDPSLAGAIANWFSAHLNH